MQSDIMIKFIDFKIIKVGSMVALVARQNPDEQVFVFQDNADILKLELALQEVRNTLKGEK